MKRRNFVKSTAALASTSLLPASVWALAKDGKLRTAHIGVGNMGGEDLKAISSHAMVEVTALCDVDANNLKAASKLHPGAKLFSDYRKMLKEISKDIDAVIVSTPDHTHAPASMMAMNMGKPVYCFFSARLHYVVRGDAAIGWPLLFAVCQLIWNCRRPRNLCLVHRSIF